MSIGHAIAFVPKVFWLFLELLARVNQHHAPAMAGGLVVSQQPDVGEDAGVVEQLVGQHDDGVEPVVLQNPAADFALARAAVAVRERRAVEDDGDAAAALGGRVILANIVCRKRSAPSLTRGIRPDNGSVSSLRASVS